MTTNKDGHQLKIERHRLHDFRWVSQWLPPGMPLHFPNGRQFRVRTIHFRVCWVGP